MYISIDKYRMNEEGNDGRRGMGKREERNRRGIREEERSIKEEEKRNVYNNIII